MKLPSAKFAMLGDRLLDNLALRFVENDRFLDHLPITPICQQRLRNVFTLMPLRPTPFVSGQPRAVTSPRHEVGEWVIGHDCFKTEVLDAGRLGAERREPSGFSIVAREWNRKLKGLYCSRYLMLF